MLPEAVKRNTEYMFSRTSSNNWRAEAVGVVHIVLALLEALRFLFIIQYIHFLGVVEALQESKRTTEEKDVMGLIYRPAPGCRYTPTPQKALMRKHLNSKLQCPCKQAHWTIEDAVRGQVDGRTTRYQRPAGGEKTTVINDNSTNIDNSNNSNTTIDNSTHIHVHIPAVLPSGSAAERNYIASHAKSIVEAITRGVAGPDADIVSRFVRQTWCSDEHRPLNNVVAYNSKSLEFMRLCEKDGKAEIEILAGKQAPGQLTGIALQTMVQLSEDVCDGYNPARHTPPIFEVRHATQQAAEEEQSRLRAGKVTRLRDWKNQTTDVWVNDRSENAPPPENPPLFHKASQIAWVPATLRQKRKDRENVEKVISCQLRHQTDRKRRKQELENSVRN